MKQTIIWMHDFLKAHHYDIEVQENKLTIVKHSDDPWNHFNKIIARPDGVYNYVEVQMGGYDEKKRVSCNGFDTACFLVLAMFVAKERKKLKADFLITAIKKDSELVVNNSSDYWGGQFIIDELISLQCITWRSTHHLSEYDCGSMQGYTTTQNYHDGDEEGVFEQFYWKRYGNNVLIMGVRDGSNTMLHIPNTINGYPVKGISDRAFMNRTFTDVFVPNSVEYIGALAIGFTSYPIYTDEDEEMIKLKKPFAHNWPASTLQDFEYYLHHSPKTCIHGSKNSIAEDYAWVHDLPFMVE